MRVLLDARPLYGGTARYVRELVRLLEAALPPGAVATLGTASLGCAEAPSEAQRSAIRRLAAACLGAPARWLADTFGIARRVRAVDADVFHATMGVVPAGLPVPAVITCHDLWALDHADERPRGWRSRYERAALAAALRRARHVIASSDTTARRLRDRLGPEAPPITRIYPPLAPPAPAAAPAGMEASGPFWLSVGTLEPRKNLARLVAAQCAAYPSSRLPLVLAGRYGWGQASVLDAIARAAGAVRWLGRVPEAELSWLYANAAGVVQFSRDEGFDYPAVEAMRAGCPLVLSDIEVHREVAAGAARYVAPDDADALARMLAAGARAGAARRTEWAEAGRARAAELALQAQARPYLEVYADALSRTASA